MNNDLIYSGIEWLGNIPPTWNIIKTKYLLNITTGKKDANAESPNGEFEFFTCSKEPKKIDSYSFDTEALLIAGNGIVGYTQYYKGKFDAYQRTYVLSNFDKKISPLFLKYYFNNLLSAKLEWDKVGSVIDFIKLGDIQNFPIVFPELSKQSKIAEYLDKECNKIDFLISKNNKEIELLNEYRNSVISEAITSGIKNTTLKKSNIDWCPYIPENWKPINPRILFTQRKEKAKESDIQLTSSQKEGIITQDEYMKITGSRVVQVEKNFEILKHVEPNDFVISMRSFQGGLEYSNISGCISSAYVMLIPNKDKVYPKFYKWFFKSSKYINALQSTSNFIRDGQAMRYSNFSQIYLFDIPMDEQIEIAEYLDKKINNIDKVISIRQKMVEKLEEYKNTLIYEVVTGKKEV